MKIRYLFIFFLFFVQVIVMKEGARSEIKFSGVSDTSAYMYPTENEDLTGTETNWRFQQGVLFDVEFTDTFGFHLNSRLIYRTNEYENPEQLAFNCYYGYFQYAFTEKLVMQMGRIMDAGNLALTYFDGANLEYGLSMFKQDFTFNLYGGMLVNDDYLDEDSIAGFNSFDFKNFFIKQRAGDYTAGMKTNCHIKDIAFVGVDYQTLFNGGSLVEQYISLDFDTLFSKKIRFYGYGTFDLIEGLPSNTLAATQINAVDKLSVIIEHEYYRPVYPRDSYFWNYFIPYGNQEISCMMVYSLTEYVTADIRYGIILYEAEGTPGHEVSAGFEHGSLYNTRIKVNGEYIFGPEGDKITLMTVLNRRFFIIDAIAGGGIVFYQDGEGGDTYDAGIYGMGGAEASIIRDLLLSVTMEYYHNPKYNYDLRGIFSLKYFF